jgi:hypothetical protein
VTAKSQAGSAQDTKKGMPAPRSSLAFGSAGE